MIYSLNVIKSSCVLNIIFKWSNDFTYWKLWSNSTKIEYKLLTTEKAVMIEIVSSICVINVKIDVKFSLCLHQNVFGIFFWLFLLLLFANRA